MLVSLEWGNLITLFDICRSCLVEWFRWSKSEFWGWLSFSSDAKNAINYKKSYRIIGYICGLCSWIGGACSFASLVLCGSFIVFRLCQHGWKRNSMDFLSWMNRFDVSWFVEIWRELLDVFGIKMFALNGWFWVYDVDFIEIRSTSVLICYLRRC